MNTRTTTKQRVARAIHGVAIALGMLGLAACASTGGLHTHARITDIGTIHASKSVKAIPLSAAAWPNGAWWKNFGDNQLNYLVDHALRGQPRLREAEARVRAAEAVAGIEGAHSFRT